MEIVAETVVTTSLLPDEVAICDDEDSFGEVDLLTTSDSDGTEVCLSSSSVGNDVVRGGEGEERSSETEAAFEVIWMLEEPGRVGVEAEAEVDCGPLLDGVLMREPLVVPSSEVTRGAEEGEWISHESS